MTFIDKVAKIIYFFKYSSKLTFLIEFYLDLDSYGHSKKQAVCVSSLRLDVMLCHLSQM